MQWRLTCVVVGVVVVVGATTVLKAIPRERVTVEDCSFQELWRQQWDCVSGELGIYRLTGKLA